LTVVSLRQRDLHRRVQPPHHHVPADLRHLPVELGGDVPAHVADYPLKGLVVAHDPVVSNLGQPHPPLEKPAVLSGGGFRVDLPGGEDAGEGRRP